MTTKLIDRGWNNIKTQIKRLQGTEITVGVQGQEAQLKDPDSDATLADIAVYNHFGTKHIPARPFLQLALDNNQKQINDFIDKNLNYLMTKKGSQAPAALNRIGAFLVGAIQREINSNIQPANAPSTIRAKKSSRTLVDSGRLRSSITYEIRY